MQSFLCRSIAIAANLPRTEAGQRKLSGGNGETHCQRIDGHRFPAHIRGIKSLVQEIRGARLSHRNGKRDCHQSRKGCYARTTDLPLSPEWSRKFATTTTTTSKNIRTFILGAFFVVLFSTVCGYMCDDWGASGGGF